MWVRILHRFGDHFGVPFGSLLGSFGPPWVHFGRPLADFATPWKHFGRTLADLGELWGSFGDLCVLFVIFLTVCCEKLFQGF